MNTQSESNNEIECHACGEKIKATAKKCKHCGSFQGYLRFLNVIKDHLAMVVAILTILSIIIPVSKYYFSSPESKFDFSVNGVKFEKSNNLFQLDILVTNSGDLQGFLGDARVTIEVEQLNEREKFTTSFAMKPLLTSDEHTFAVGDHKVVTFGYDHPIYYSISPLGAGTHDNPGHFEGLLLLMEELKDRAELVNGEVTYGELNAGINISYSTSSGVFYEHNIAGSEKIESTIFDIIFHDLP